jgi:hypothetical protein
MDLAQKMAGMGNSFVFDLLEDKFLLKKYKFHYL